MMKQNRCIFQLLLLWILLLEVSAAKAACPADSITSDSVVKAYFQERNIKIHSGNRVVLLRSGAEKFDDMFDAIRHAKHNIHLEYFNFRNDSIANVLFDLLAEKVKEGVEVRALFDAFGNMSNNRPLKNKHLKSIRERGIEIYKFDPIKFPWIDHVFKRDHRKIVVIDGEIGYTGGMNVADYYIHGTPAVGAWHDIHLRIEGSAVYELQKIFLITWNQVTGQRIIGGREYFPPLKTLSGDLEEVAIVDRRPNYTPKAIRESFEVSIASAQKKIQLINPYFAPTHGVKKALKRALKRGVEVEIMIPAVSDIPFTPDAALYQVHQLQKRGAKVYLYQGGFHHSKVMMIDGLYSTAGSANMNSRSLRFDYEVNAFMFNGPTTGQLVQMFENDKLNSEQMTRETWKKRSPWKRFVGWFAHLFTPIL